MDKLKAAAQRPKHVPDLPETPRFAMRGGAVLLHHHVHFPVLIVVYAVCRASISPAAACSAFGRDSASDVVKVFLDYMKYVGGNESSVMIYVASS
jgi:hypothetical protein